MDNTTDHLHCFCYSSTTTTTTISTNPTITPPHFVQWRATFPHIRNIQQLLVKKQPCHTPLPSHRFSPCTSVTVFKYECKCRDALYNMLSGKRMYHCRILIIHRDNGLKCLWFVSVRNIFLFLWQNPTFPLP